MNAQNVTMQYAIVRFSPFVETQEFANAGVVLFSREAEFFDYRVETRRHARITGFFKPLDPAVYRAAMRQVAEEMQRVKQMNLRGGSAQTALDLGEADLVRQMFRDLVSHREGIVRFSPVRIVRGNAPSDTLNELYRHYVDRQFVTPAYNERMLEAQVKEVLLSGAAKRKFVREKIGDETYQKSFPFVARDDGKVSRVIKPIYLGQRRPEAIIDHGVRWKYAVERLKDGGFLPQEVLFPLKGPKGSGKQMQAFHEVEGMLREAGVKTASIEDEDRILSYADS